MKGWRAVAWACSWIAPVSFFLAGIALGLGIAAERGVFLSSSASVLSVAAFVFASVGVVAHTLLVYQVHRGAGLRRGESSRLAGLLQLGFGYGEWRRAIRANPEQQSPDS